MFLRSHKEVEAYGILVLFVYTLVCVGCDVMCCVSQVKGTSGKDVWILDKYWVLVKFRKGRYKK